MMSTVSIITAGTLIVSLASFQSENNVANEVEPFLIMVAEMDNEQTVDAGPLISTVNGLRAIQSENGVRNYAERFEITQNSSKAELEAIKKTAINDGIEMEYEAQFNNNKLEKLSLDMLIDNPVEGRKQSLTTSLDVDGTFSYTLAWENDAKGKAIKIYYGKTEGFDEADAMQDFDEGLKEVEERMADLNFDGLMENMDSLMSNMTDQFNFDQGSMQEEMNQMKKEFEKSRATKSAEMKEEMRQMKEDFEKQKQEMKAEMEEMKRNMNQKKENEKPEKEKLEDAVKAKEEVGARV
jgi:hypothetical protein